MEVFKSSAWTLTYRELRAPGKAEAARVHEVDVRGTGAPGHDGACGDPYREVGGTICADRVRCLLGQGQTDRSPYDSSRSVRSGMWSCGDYMEGDEIDEQACHDEPREMTAHHGRH